MIKPHHRIALAAAAVYLASVALVVFWPTPVDRPASGTLHEIISWLHGHGMPKILGYNQIEFTANIAMFVPMGYIASVFFKSARLGIIAGALVSCLIELCQAILLPDRFASGLDVLANSLGATIGASAYYLANRSRRRRVENSVLDPVRPHGATVSTRRD